MATICSCTRFSDNPKSIEERVDLIREIHPGFLDEAIDNKKYHPKLVALAFNIKAAGNACTTRCEKPCVANVDVQQHVVNAVRAANARRVIAIAACKV